VATIIRKLTQIGNSKGIIVPQTLLELLDWNTEAEVELKIDGKKLIVSPSNRRTAMPAEVKAVSDKVFTKHRRLMEKLSK